MVVSGAAVVVSGAAELESSLDEDDESSSNARASGALPVEEQALMSNASPASKTSMRFRLNVGTTGVLLQKAVSYAIGSAKTVVSSALAPNQP